MMIAALLATLALASPAPTPEHGRVVEEVVAVVRNPAGAPPRVITLTKLIEEARVALVARGATEAATRPLDPEALRAALDWLLDQMLVADEAARLKLDDVDGKEIEAELRRFQERFASDALYRRFLEATELPEEELALALARGLRVQRYVESRVGRTARVSDGEVDRWLRARGAEPAPGPAREAARAQLSEERAEAQVKDLLAELRGRADVRVLDPLRGPPGQGG
jgi:hypothetical protein